MIEPKKTLSLPAIAQEPIPVPPSEPKQPDTDTLPQSVHQSAVTKIMQRVQYRFDTFANTVLCHGLLDGKWLLATAMYAAVSDKKFSESKGRLATKQQAEKMCRKEIGRLEGYKLYTERAESALLVVDK